MNAIAQIEVTAAAVITLPAMSPAAPTHADMLNARCNLNFARGCYQSPMIAEAVVVDYYTSKGMTYYVVSCENSRFDGRHFNDVEFTEALVEYLPALS
jgi:hypothetical protein